MAANAPYYQLQRQFTDGTNAPFGSDADEYDLSASIAPQPGSLFVNDHNQDHQSNSLEENHNLVELLEAATTAAGQAVQAMNNDERGSRQAANGRSKRKRASSPLGDADADADAGHGEGRVPAGRKRARIRAPTDPALQDHHNSMQTSSDGKVPQPSSESLLVDARPAGVHSAAALFRRSSEKTSRKYTRPPMSKLFMSLQLTPENFLHLQSQAKTYMLDLDHPERQNCVGNRGKGDTDMVKLRLFNCVKDFLADGVGEEFFGANVEKPGEKEAIEAARALGQEKAPSEGRLVWPREGNKIISLVTPLLRRMVTNERQRMYAIETRKGGAKKDASVEAATPEPDPRAAPPSQSSRLLQPLQTTFDSTSYPIAQHSIPSPHSHSHSTSPVLSLPLNPSTMAVPYPELSFNSSSENSPHGDVELEMQALRTREVPTQNPFELHSIRINLAKNGVRLRTHRKLRCPERDFRKYTLEQLIVHIKLLIRSCQEEYPELRDTSSSDAFAEQMKGKAEALRGLAVAATEINSHDQTQTSVDDNADREVETRIDSIAHPHSQSQYPVQTTSAMVSSTPIPIPSPSINTPSKKLLEPGPSSILLTEEAPITAGPDLGFSAPDTMPSSSRSQFYNAPATETASTDALAPQSPRGTPALQTQFGFDEDAAASASTSASAAVQDKELVARTQPSPDGELLRAEPGWPKFVMKAVTSTGLRDVRNEEVWGGVKEDVGLGAWAGGVMFVLVELV